MAQKTDVVHIVPINPRIANQVLSGKYDYNGRVRIKTGVNTWVEKDLIPTKDNPHPEPMDLKFINNPRGISMLVHEYKVVGVDEENMRTHEAQNTRYIKEFLQHHPQTIINGVAHDNTSISPMFDIVWQSVKEDTVVATFEQRFDAIAYVKNFMNFEQKRDLLFYYGINANGLNENQLTMKLIGEDMASGVLFTKTKDRNNLHEFDRIRKDENTTYATYINIRKALAYGIIELKKKGNSPNYFYGSEFIGTSEGDVVNFFYKNNKLMEAMESRVKEKDTDDIKKYNVVIKPEEKIVNTKTKTNDDIYKERLKAVRKFGFWLEQAPSKFSPEDIIRLEKIEEQVRELMLQKTEPTSK